MPCGIDDAFDVKYVCVSGLSNAMNTTKKIKIEVVVGPCMN